MRRHYNSHIILKSTTPTSSTSISSSPSNNNSDLPIIHHSNNKTIRQQQQQQQQSTKTTSSFLFNHPPRTITTRKRSNSKTATTTKVVKAVVLIVLLLGGSIFIVYYYYFYHYDNQSNTTLVVPHHVRTTNANVLQSNVTIESIHWNESFQKQQLDDFTKKNIEVKTNTTKLNDETETITWEQQHQHYQHHVIDNTGGSTSSTGGSNNINIPPLVYPIDYEKFTIRINTWKRTDQLKASIEHFSTCTAVCQIQIIWCIDQGEPPEWLLTMENETNNYNNTTNICLTTTTTQSILPPTIIIERHTNNSLNERFLLLQPVYTAGVLSIDDDVIRPCFAIHSAFLKWTYNPDRQVGFDARSHDITIIQRPTNNSNTNTNKQEKDDNNEQWGYSYLSTTEKNNKYSITLTRFSFQHQYYFKSYWNNMPTIIRNYIKTNMNCEDIAMSLWISSQTNNIVPLLADYWIVKSQIQLYVPNKISAGSNHKAIRNECFNMFSTILNLKSKLQLTPLRHTKDKYHGFYDYGIPATDWNKQNLQLQLDQESSSASSTTLLQFHQNIIQTINHWKHKGTHYLFYQLQQMRKIAAQPLYDKSMLDKKLKTKK